ncbi:hypothetical protein CPB83DRAFT_808097 [Crepidotus variabilis]|uniref:Uncharacterized protein n=1 Tax=Crepidotus variabilis TaxID=179855 RepID=A0A9P6JT43_9AGAR|nr:hypothetical protein CPB83DRAFT_808097 [Crepidotus variabilis]
MHQLSCKAPWLFNGDGALMNITSRTCLLFLVITTLAWFSNHQNLNTTVVILNWSRLPNVNEIISQICTNLLDDTVHEIIIWNNNPQELSFYLSFPNTTCPQDKLRIINSPANLYFQARFMACAEVKTKYCFIQDDDYLIRPRIIRALSQRMESRRLSSIHLQPPHEMLTSELRTITIQDNIHATFAWLGYGTIIKRSLAVDFLALLDQLNLTDEEHKMADNYFTILGNWLPERWFDPGISLGGGQPFTVGSEGEERNNRHIRRAADLLNEIMSTNRTWPYVSNFQSNRYTKAITTAPCQQSACIFETSINLLPSNILEVYSAKSAVDILIVEQQRKSAVGENRVSHYLDFPPSNAVDGETNTAFCSFEGVGENDWVSLQLLDSRRTIDLGLVVDQASATLIEEANTETSEDGINWILSDSTWTCEAFTKDETGRLICKEQLDLTTHYIRLRMSRDYRQRLCIFEIFV